MSFNNGKLIYLVDKYNFYKMNMDTKQCEAVHGNQFCIGLYLSDGKFLYALCHKNNHRKSGFKLYDMENVITKNKDIPYHLTNA